MTETPVAPRRPADEAGAPGPALRGRVHQTLHLARDTPGVHALLSVDAEGVTGPGDGGSGSGAPEAAEVIVIDASRSMGYPPGTAEAAADAAAAAIGQMRDGTHFAVLAGTDVARQVWPPTGGLVAADDTTRARAVDALRAITVGGGTRIGRWLHAAADLLAAHPGAIRHTILLSDGDDQHETREALDAAIDATRDTMSCDCRGVGDGWRFDELHAVSSAMHGTTRRVAEAAGLAEDFRATMAASMAKEVAQVALRLWTPVGARVRLVAQSAPDAVDLTDRRVEEDEQVGLYPTGAWGAEQRDFHLHVDVPPAEPGRTRLAARVSFVRLDPDGTAHPLPQQHVRPLLGGGEETRDEARIAATWTDDPELETGRAEPVERVETETRIAERIRAAMAALDRGADDEAEGLLRVAREWATGLGQAELVRQIDELFEPETDTFRAGGPNRAQALDLEVTAATRPVQARAGE